MVYNHESIQGHGCEAVLGETRVLSEGTPECRCPHLAFHFSMSLLVCSNRLPFSMDVDRELSDPVANLEC
jgi:hypothetical protein